MQDLIHAFGIDWRLIMIQVFNFAILAGALWYFLYTPVLKLISDREDKIKKGVEDAQKAEDALKQSEIEKTKVLQEAHTEASLIVSRSTKHAQEVAKTIEEDSADKIAKQIIAANALADEMRVSAIKASEAEIAKVALLGAEKILNERLQK